MMITICYFQIIRITIIILILELINSPIYEVRCFQLSPRKPLVYFVFRERALTFRRYFPLSDISKAPAMVL